MATDLLSAISDLVNRMHADPRVGYVTISATRNGAIVGVQIKEECGDGDIADVALAMMASGGAAYGAELLNPGEIARTPDGTCEWYAATLRVGEMRINVYGAHRTIALATEVAS